MARATVHGGISRELLADAASPQRHADDSMCHMIREKALE